MIFTKVDRWEVINLMVVGIMSDKRISLVENWEMSASLKVQGAYWRMLFHNCNKVEPCLAYNPVIPNDQVLQFCKHCTAEIPQGVRKALIAICNMDKMK